MKQSCVKKTCSAFFNQSNVGQLEDIQYITVYRLGLSLVGKCCITFVFPV